MSNVGSENQKYNKASIMRRAWELYRQFYNSCDGHGFQLSVALRMAWKEAKQTLKVARIAADKVLGARLADLKEKAQSARFLESVKPFAVKQNLSQVHAIEAEIANLQGGR